MGEECLKRYCIFRKDLELTAEDIISIGDKFWVGLLDGQQKVSVSSGRFNTDKYYDFSDFSIKARILDAFKNNSIETFIVFVDTRIELITTSKEIAEKKNLLLNRDYGFVYKTVNGEETEAVLWFAPGIDVRELL